MKSCEQSTILFCYVNLQNTDMQLNLTILEKKERVVAQSRWVNGIKQWRQTRNCLPKSKSQGTANCYKSALSTTSTLPNLGKPQRTEFRMQTTLLRPHESAAKNSLKYKFMEIFYICTVYQIKKSIMLDPIYTVLSSFSLTLITMHKPNRMVRL